jgi:chromosome segregation protein
MYLEEIQIIGFKSFANKTVLKFPKPEAKTKGVTAIVGPNGSGKSNVADAIRWVLGESSAKTLRGKSRDDVIFAGSPKKSRMNFAEVTLKINNQDHSSDVEYSEIEITRRVFRDGESEFLLNKNKARREDVQMLLAKAGFGQKTYTVIGQGMADAVLSASLQERKEFFDEAVGVKQYQIKRDQAINKFKGTRENLAHTEMTIGDLEPRLKYLSRKIKKLEQREEIEKQLKGVQSSYYKQLHGNLSEQIGTNQTARTALEKEINKLQSEIDSQQSKMNQLYTGDSRQQVFTGLQQDYNKLIQEKNSLLREEALIKAKKDAEYQKSGQTNLVWLTNKKEELERKMHDLKQQVIQFERQLSERGEQLSRNVATMDQLTKRIESVKKDLTSIKESKLSEFNESDELKEIYALQEKLLNDLINITTVEELETIRNQARELTAKFKLYLEKIQLKKQVDGVDLTNLQGQLENLLDEKNQLFATSSQLESAVKTIEANIAGAKSSIVDAQTEVQKIQDEISLSKNMASGTDVLKTIDDQIAGIQAKVALLEKDIKEIDAKIAQFNEAEEEKKEALIALQKNIQQLQNQQSRLSQQLNSLSIEIAKYSTRLEDLEGEILEEKLTVQSVNELGQTMTISVEEAREQIQSMKKQLEMIGGIDQETIDEHRQIKERYEFLTTQVTDMEQAIVSLEKVIEELDETIKVQFEESFAKINNEFKKFFSVLFHGGTAELVKVTLKEEKENADTENTEAEEVADSASSVLVDKISKRLEQKQKDTYAGIEIKAEPPGKKIKSISMLSGGERALTSIALICAIISNNKSPFVVLDEMDSALDESNAIRFAEIIGELSHLTQFIVITHTRATMSQAQILYGVTMGDEGISKLLSIELKDAEEMDVVRH